MPPKKHQHLSPEERKKLKKQKKLEKKLRKAEQKKQLKRDHLGREVKYGDITYRKYEKNWRDMLIKVALPRMKSELEYAWHNFERVIDCKDFAISLLMDEIRDSEEQYMRNFQAHSVNMEKLLEMFHDRMDELKADFEDQVKLMLERSENEVSSIKDENNEVFDYIKTMIYQLELQKREHIRLQRGDYFSRLDEVDVKNQLLLQKLKASLETKYQTMFDDMKRFLKNYNKRIRERKKEYYGLKMQEDSIQDLIAQQFKQMRKLQNTVRLLKQKYVDIKQTDGSTLIDFQEERRFFSESFLSLKANLEIDKLNDFKKLAYLSENSDKVFECLQRLNKKGEMILSLAVVCRKLETQKEKVLPFPLSKIVLKKDVNQEDDEKIEGVKPEMELFWQRLGQVYSVHYTLSREKRCLTEENLILIDTHNEYCEYLAHPPIIKKRGETIPKADGNYEMKKYDSKETHL